MIPAARFSQIWPVAGGIVALAALGLWQFPRPTEPARSFVPGPLGQERGGPLAQPTPRAFQTRVLGVNDPFRNGEWNRRNGLTEMIPFSHNLSEVFPRELAETRPEFFPLEKGVRMKPRSGVVNWNPDIGRPDVAAYAAAAARTYFDRNPGAASFPLGTNDGLIYGESPELLALATPVKWFRERPDYTRLVFTFMNRVAEEVAHTHPEKLLGALAYYWAESPPEIPLHPAILPFLTADRAQGYDPIAREEELRLQESWARVGTRRLGMYDYLFGKGFLIPRVHTRLLAENIRHARAVGFTDYYAEMNPNWGLDGPMPWLAAQLLLDPARPEAELLDEYYRRFFREAAAPMRSFFERCEHQWMTQPGPSYWLKHYRNESQARIFPSAATAEMRLLLDEAQRRAASETVRARVRLVSDAFGLTERFVHFYEARDALSRLILTPGAGWSALAVALDRYGTAKRAFVSYAFELRRTQPLAVTAIGWEDFIRNDPSSAAVAAIARDAARTAATAQAALTLGRLSSVLTADDWPGANALMAGASRSVMRNGAMTGELRPSRIIAGLDYGASLPAEWLSKAEPSQFHNPVLVDRAEGRVLRVTGAKDISVHQWNAVGGAGLHRVSVALRGSVMPSTAVTLMLGWLDAKEKHVGLKLFRLPEGGWPEWVTLEVAALPPAGAAWVGVGVRVQNQVSGDWIEAKDFSLVTVP
jgi:hypothetical protein